jgi:hypothetical protein
MPDTPVRRCTTMAVKVLLKASFSGDYLVMVYLWKF